LRRGDTELGGQMGHNGGMHRSRRRKVEGIALKVR
jgi:hypothetical protein